ncbi:hypothetical protein ACTJJ0_21050 [Chitinophaga sp. 22321]|uniref:Natural product n=1 Tax=Chitinophaga hostae TaxID=2831022 RepID=A0ABS5J435_9BACT|nr:hypothetical protein [Chitinophaga hostae]MBS0029975.1 hypothetical protein [Chitinophaga hostae]
MKKLKLKALELGVTELLSREQLKKVFGGVDGSGSGGDCKGDKFEVCKGQAEGTKCCFTYSGTVYSGKCYAFAPDYKIHCSDLN